VVIYLTGICGDDGDNIIDAKNIARELYNGYTIICPHPIITHYGWQREGDKKIQARPGQMEKIDVDPENE